MQKVVFGVLKQQKNFLRTFTKINTQQFFNKRRGMRGVYFSTLLKGKVLSKLELDLVIKIGKYLVIYELYKMETHYKQFLLNIRKISEYKEHSLHKTIN